MNISDSWIKNILTNEDNGVRFERIANAVIGGLEGIEILQTSTNYDAARDGKSLAKLGVFVFSSLDESEDKADRDATSFAKHKASVARAKHIYFCTNAAITDAAGEKIIAAIKRHLPEIQSADALGLHQIVPLIRTYCMPTFRSLYAAELEDITRLLRPSDAAEEFLLLAAGLFEESDTLQLRDELERRMVMMSLLSGPKGPTEIEHDVSKTYQCDFSSANQISVTCESLQRTGHAKLSRHHWELTPPGRAEIEKWAAGSQRDQVAFGRDIKKAMEASLGESISPSSWKGLWTHLQREVTLVALAKGMHLLQMAKAFADGTQEAMIADGDGFLDAISKAVRGSFSAPNHGRMLQAAHDAFLPSAAGNVWLQRIAVAYAAICAMGVATEVRMSIQTALSAVRFVIDTDAVISYLCPHESGHEGMKSLGAMALALEAHLIVADAVAEEVARHASKSYVDYDSQVLSSARPLRWYEIESLQSAFTREFEYLRIENRVKSSSWQRFIGQYAGVRRLGPDGRLLPDVSKMRQLLASEHFLILPRLNKESGAQRRITVLRDKLLKFRRKDSQGQVVSYREDVDPISLEKARLDAELVVALDIETQRSEAEGIAHRFVLVTSSTAMRRAVSELGLKSQPEILTIGEAAFLSTLLPSRPASVRGLSAMLADEQFMNTVGDLEARLLAVIRRSSFDQLPGATRGMLIQGFRDKLFEGARRSGGSVQEYRGRLRDDPVQFGRLAAAVVEAHGLTEPTTRDEVLHRIEEIARKLDEPGVKPKP